MEDFSGEFIKSTKTYIKLSKTDFNQLTNNLISNRIQNPRFKQINMTRSKKNKLRTQPDDAGSRNFAAKIKLAMKLKNKHHPDV
jgi:hypothetical protein